MQKQQDHPNHSEEYRKRQSRLVAGVMSGTSLDGVDVAFVRLQGTGSSLRFQNVGFYFTPYATGLQSQLLRACNGTLPLHHAYQLDVDLGMVYSSAIQQAAIFCGIDIAEIDAVGLHGQTIYHNPRRAPAGVTVQIGSGSVVAEQLGTIVVNDFRTNDVAAGGEGAPLVPYCDLLLLGSPTEHRVVLNIGGIANITALPRDASADTLVAFDTGPGNMMIDAAMRQLFGRDYDDGGAVAASGTVNHGVLQELLRHPYFHQIPPKSAGREDFGEELSREIAQMAVEAGFAPETVIATLTQLTATSIAEGIHRFSGISGPIETVIVGGGGVRNQTLMRMLAEQMPNSNVVPSDQFKLPSDAKEAICFAVLANEAICQTPANIPSVTGATRRVVCGAIRVGTRR
ncbi:MAG: anhydro-N-acetylmuramic acid kinase [Armatimonadetes bacterium]|nr:anhydro-N-acetylmuramic acid kinase [Armatimonadota bacterium]